MQTIAPLSERQAERSGRAGRAGKAGKADEDERVAGMGRKLGKSISVSVCRAHPHWAHINTASWTNGRPHVLLQRAAGSLFTAESQLLVFYTSPSDRDTNTQACTHIQTYKQTNKHTQNQFKYGQCSHCCSSAFVCLLWAYGAYAQYASHRHSPAPAALSWIFSQCGWQASSLAA